MPASARPRTAEEIIADDWVIGPPRPRPVEASQLSPGLFRLRRAVRFGDCDPAGIVYTPRFVNMLNEVLESFFPDALGLDYYGLIRDEKVGLGYARVGCDFMRPGLMGDELDFTVRIARVGGASAGFIIHAHRGEDEVLRGTMVRTTTVSLVTIRVHINYKIRTRKIRTQQQRKIQTAE